eukprot:TRINITY_DN962_c0_g1_i1.p1 TRINITY_DN962_c0_g1~~TRINITY_DN962_c0_g1_i1.p1  ORF type:complete len:355 (+),score=112.34 TRINITY_DN962_c0_g1_i1:54-1118(+)
MSSSAVKVIWSGAAVAGAYYGMDSGVIPRPSILPTFSKMMWGFELPESELRNEAFVFVKPHANTDAVRKLVKERLQKAGINVTSEGEITGEEINDNLYIDQHYYAIASKATILKPHELNVPADKFKDKFGFEWSDAIKQGITFNAMDACEKLGCDAAELDRRWAQAKKDNKLVKFGGGFYCGELTTAEGTSIYVFNGFFMSMRSKFTTPGTSIHYYTVDFSSKTTKWDSFRNDVLGPTDPAEAPAGSLRREVFENWEALGLDAVPNVGDNGVHASASPFEGLAERMNWLKTPVSNDKFGSAAVEAGVSKSTIKAWSVDPQVPTGVAKEKKSLFDQLEDLDATPCLNKMVRISSL